MHASTQHLALLSVLLLVEGAPRPASPIKVACVGDSITAGYLASPASNAYPARLQQMLDAKFGNGSYEVSNFGAGGATVQRGADSPYWNRTQFAQWTNSTWDIVVMMLGTNDAKVSTEECVARWGPGPKCSPNWPASCSSPNPTPDNCTVMGDYLAMIRLARTLGISGRTPLITLMTPPPLWKDGAYGMSNVVINDKLSSIVPALASLASLPAPIDIFGTLGGVADWRTSYPVCGCQRPPSVGDGSRAPTNFSVTQGYMSDNEVIETKNLTWSAAAAACAADGECAGFTFKSNDSKPAAPVTIRLKHCDLVDRNTKIGWWSWTKPPGSVPAPSMPKACPLFCQNGQSCDPCHPDNDGYALLASKVFDWIVDKAAHPQV